MAVEVETLDKLERRITLSLPAASIASEVESRLRRLSRTVKADGFRPGKVPMSVVSQRYGYSVHSEVLNDKVGQVFSDAVNEAIIQAAAQRGPAVRVVDLRPTFTPGDTYRDSIPIGGDQTIVRESDGIHLNEEGASVAADLVLQAIDRDFNY